MAGITRKHCPGIESDSSVNLTGCRADNQTIHSRGVCGRALKFRYEWEGFSGKCYCRQPDSGNPTVRDERGAYGNVGYGGARNPSHRPKGCVSETLRLRLRAPYFYPTALQSGGGREMRPLRSRVNNISRQAISLRRPFGWRHSHCRHNSFDICLRPLAQCCLTAL